jgi:hypothetical protein
VSEDIDRNDQRAAAIRPRIAWQLAGYDEILKREKTSLSHYTAVSDLFKTTSGTFAEPPVMLDSEDDDDPDDSPTYSSKQQCLYLKLPVSVISYVCEFFVLLFLSYLSDCIA